MDAKQITRLREDLDSAFPSIGREHWGIDPGCVFLNHGSFGACPRPVLARQRSLMDEMESNLMRFMLDRAPELEDRAREAVAGLVGARARNIGFVHNATAGVNAVLRSLRFERDDEILILDHAYNACANVAGFVAERWGARITRAVMPWPVADPDQVVDAVLDAVTDRTKLAMIDHITSPSAVVLPIERIVRALESRGVDTLVDAAHAPGMVPLDLNKLGAAYFTANCHKWLCSPKSCAILHVREDRQDGIEPHLISHGSNNWGKGSGEFAERFRWLGTHDPTPIACVADSIEFLDGLFEDGIPGLMSRNHALAVRWAEVLRRELGITRVCPDSMLGTMVTIPLFRGGPAWEESDRTVRQKALFKKLRGDLGIEVPEIVIGDDHLVCTRVSAPAYIGGGDLAPLVEALRGEIDPGVI